MSRVLPPNLPATASLGASNLKFHAVAIAANAAMRGDRLDAEKCGSQLSVGVGATAGEAFSGDRQADRQADLQLEVLQIGRAEGHDDLIRASTMLETLEQWPVASGTLQQRPQVSGRKGLKSSSSTSLMASNCSPNH